MSVFVLDIAACLMIHYNYGQRSRWSNMILHIPFQLVLLCCVYFGSGTDVNDTSELELTVAHVADRSVEMRWRGMDLNDVTDCELNYSANSSFEWTMIDYTPVNNTFPVPDLQPSTFYKFTLVCHDPQKKKYKSEFVNFTTAVEGSTVTFPETTRTVLLPSTVKTLPRASTMSPEIVNAGATKTTQSMGYPSSTVDGVIETETSPMDIGLGIAFGFIGCGVFGMMAYFCIKEYRRRLRIRRFLQYRQQENETFPDMDNDDDEGIVI